MGDVRRCPCKSCGKRIYIARVFDVHFYGEDCPYVCKAYDEWRENNGLRK